MLRLARMGLASLTAIVMLSAGAGTVHAALMLMSTDGAAFWNNPRATALGHTVTTNTLSGIVGTAVSTLSGFDVIWINPVLSSANYTTLQTGVANGGSLEQYVFGGGILVLNIAGNFGDKSDIAPGGVDLIRNPNHQSEIFTTPGHAYLTGNGFGGASLTTGDFLNWSYTDHGRLANLPPLDSTTILSNTDGVSLVEYQYGSGRVLLTTVTFGWAGTGIAIDNWINYSAFASSQVAVPEPATILLLTSGLVALRMGRGGRRRRSP